MKKVAMFAQFYKQWKSDELWSLFDLKIVLHIMYGGALALERAVQCKASDTLLWIWQDVGINETM